VEVFNRDKILLFLVFFFPGFVSVKVYDWLMPGQPRKFTDAVLEVVGFSCWNYAALSWWLIHLVLKTQPKQFLDWTVDLQLFLIWFIIPGLWPLAYYRLSSTALYSRYFGSPIPTAWDKAFRRRKGGWVIVHLKDDRRIGGLYGTSSYASSYPQKETLYLQQEWKLDEQGRLDEPVEGTDGILVMSDQILTVEFFAAEPLPDTAAGNPPLEQTTDAATRMEIDGE